MQRADELLPKHRLKESLQIYRLQEIDPEILLPSTESNRDNPGEELKLTAPTQAETLENTKSPMSWSNAHLRSKSGKAGFQQFFSPTKTHSNLIREEEEIDLRYKTPLARTSLYKETIAVERSKSSLGSRVSRGWAPRTDERFTFIGGQMPVNKVQKQTTYKKDANERTGLECRLIKGLHQLFSMQKKRPNQKLKDYLERIFPINRGYWLAFKAYNKMKMNFLKLTLRDFVEVFTDTFSLCNSSYKRNYKQKQDIIKAIHVLEMSSYKPDSPYFLLNPHEKENKIKVRINDVDGFKDYSYISIYVDSPLSTDSAECIANFKEKETRDQFEIPIEKTSKNLKFQVNSLNTPLTLGTASIGILKICKGLFLKEKYSTTLNIYEGLEEESEAVQEDIIYTKETLEDEDQFEQREHIREVKGKIKITLSAKVNSECRGLVEKAKALKLTDLQEKRILLTMNIEEAQLRMREVLDLVEGYEFVDGVGVIEQGRRAQHDLLKLGGDQRRCDFCQVKKCGIF